MTRAALLAVVSTDPQAGEDRYSLPMQLETARAAAQRIEAAVVAEFSFAHSRSYDALADLCRDSPDYARLVDLIQQGRLDLLIVYRYDRIGRTLLLQLEMLRLCKRHGVAVWSVTEAPNGPETGADEWMLQVMRGMMAEQEVRAIVTRSKAGKLGRAKAGMHMSWTHPPYGYKVDGDHARPLVPDPVTTPIVRQLFAWRAEGWGARHIAAEANARGLPTRHGAPWQTSSVARILHNPYYAGLVPYNGAAYPGQHTPLITPDQWAAVQRINASLARDRARPGGDRFYLLSGLLRCGFCDGAIGYHTSCGRAYVRCVRNHHSGGRECQTNQHTGATLHSWVRDQMRAVVADPAAHMAALARQHQQPEQAARIIEAQTALAELDAQEARIVEAVATGRFALDRLIAQQDKLTVQRAAVTAELAQLNAASERLARTASVLRSLPPDVNALDDPALRSLCRQLIYRIILRRGEPPVILWLV